MTATITTRTGIQWRQPLRHVPVFSDGYDYDTYQYLVTATITTRTGLPVFSVPVFSDGYDDYDTYRYLVRLLRHVPVISDGYDYNTYRYLVAVTKYRYVS